MMIKKYNFPGNKIILLDSLEKVWFVKSGSLAIFSTKVEAGEPIGNRRYLFDVSAGEVIFGSRLWSDSETNIQLCMMALTLEKAELELVEFSNIIAATEENIRLIETWLSNLNQLLLEEVKPDIKVVVKKELEQVYLLPGEALQAAYQSVIWVQVCQGKALWMGREDFSLDEKQWFPVTDKTWLQASAEIEVKINITTGLNYEQFLNGFNIFYSYLYCYIYQISLKEIELKMQKNQQLNRDVLQKTLVSLAANLTQQKQTFIEEETSLLMAVGAVGRAMGIKIIPPKLLGKEQLQNKDMIEAIAQASQIRTRQVTLTGYWWRQDNGPLLAFTQAENLPVALLIDKSQGDRYFLFDPELQSRTLISEHIATTLAPESYMFYRSLPSVIKKKSDVLLFGIQGFVKDIFVILAVGMMGTLLSIFTPQATAILIDTAIPNSDQFLLIQLTLGLLAVSFGRTILNLSQSLISQRIAAGTTSQIQIAVWDKFLKLKPAFIRQFSSGDMLLRIMSISQIYSIISGAIQRTFLNGLFALLNLGLMFIYSSHLALVGVSITLVVIGFTIILSKILLAQERQQQELISRLHSLVVQMLNGVAKLRVAAAETRAFTTWAKIYNQQIHLDNIIIYLNDIVSLFNELIFPVSYLLLYWLGLTAIQSSLVGQGNLSLGTFLAFNAAFGTFLAGVTSLSNTLVNIVKILPLWQRTASILQGELECDTNKNQPALFQGRITLKNVSFRYFQDGQLILNDVNIHAQPGEFIAIVGPSGSGKSTLLRLLLGFETPLNGTISYDDQNLATLNLSAVRRQLGVVLQNSKIMPGSIFDNITTGAFVTMEQAWSALRMAGLAADIEAMPMGIHTLVSEGGGNISGGQLQRLLIARSLVFKPKIILMDEATSFLDNHTQAIVTESLARLNVTRIVIAHRLSTIRYADRIYVMESGKIIQVGSFTELMQQPGLFAKLVARQLH
ncbi:NHLP bacteriocin export ABC transporter permease/ATPase subunit [Anabaena sp. UHCC 0451]|uniref:NHLP bacteriocin export ABC transporter permease/ATPase subunit n=1 Tax=Anabaena sp. UHCC 0451 TaxID=2055235 RepID=UPI002B21D0C1|nr:NHLP bacteriocin export ABC transporter permease/ATPase subunit [Anabaena sp. UHCC 0451]MEA5575512.1 NHLP bacteriocin export ABC transporter permease/ATPase subunit [Anabaena sp. UHCC 0451]